MINILIDNDVVIDFLTDRHPFTISAKEVFLKCAENDFNIFITSLTLANTYYILKKSSHHKKVIETLIEFCTLVKIIEVNSSVCINA